MIVINCKFKTFFSFVHEANHFVYEQHDYNEIIFYKKGYGKTMIGDDIFEFNNGSVVLIPKNTWHDEIAFDKTEVIFCLFSCDEDLGFVRQKMFECNERQYSVINEIFNKIQNEYKTQAPYSDDMLNHYVSQLLIEFLRNEESKVSADDIIRYIKVYLKEYCTQKINFEVLCDNMNYSYSRLRHIFKETCGVSMKQYQLNCRINASKKLLETTNFSINKISVNCGFTETSKFIEAFKQRCGKTPQQYRNLIHSYQSEE